MTRPISNRQGIPDPGDSSKAQQQEIARVAAAADRANRRATVALVIAIVAALISLWPAIARLLFMVLMSVGKPWG